MIDGAKPAMMAYTQRSMMVMIDDTTGYLFSGALIVKQRNRYMIPTCIPLTANIWTIPQSEKFCRIS